MNNELCKAAIEYAKKGWKVFPCKADKTPYTPQGLKNGTTDLKTIKKWWLDWPDAGIGVVCGKDSKLLVVDIDKKSGGLTSYNEWKKQYGQFTTAKVRTGGGGLHFYFTFPSVEVRNSTSKIADGIDIRGEGGYVIAPPSGHVSGKKYKWLKDIKPTKSPDWLLKKIKTAKSKRTINNLRNAQEGSRNDSLASYAGHMRAVGFDFAFAKRQLLDMNQTFKPPLPIDEVISVAESIYLYECKEMLTDVGNARRFAAQHVGELLYCYRWNKWTVWNGQRWSLETGEAAAVQAAKRTAKAIYMEASFCKDENRSKAVASWAHQSSSKYAISSMLGLARDEKEIATYPNQFDQNDMLLNCLNGTIDLHTGKLKAHDSRDKITKLAQTEYPAKIGQKATIQENDMPVWLNCLNEWMVGNKDLILYLQKLAGYCLNVAKRYEV